DGHPREPTVVGVHGIRILRGPVDPSPVDEVASNRSNDDASNNAGDRVRQGVPPERFRHVSHGWSVPCGVRAEREVLQILSPRRYPSRPRRLRRMGGSPSPVLFRGVMVCPCMVEPLEELVRLTGSGFKVSPIPGFGSYQDGSSASGSTATGGGHIDIYLTG